MYYSDTCPYCSKIFYTFNDSKEAASKILYAGIKQHLIDYNEDSKEYKLDDTPKEDSDEIYAELTETNEPPQGGFELE